MHPRFTETTYHHRDGTTSRAIFWKWDDVASILGRPHEGTAEDDQVLITLAMQQGAPAIYADASGWIDEQGWGLIGPEIDEQD